jgi:hypothetical protein
MRIDPPYDASPLDRLPHPELVLETPEASAVVTPIRPDLPSTVAPTSSDAGFLKFPTSNNSSGHLASYNTQGRSSASAVLPQHVHPTCPLDRILLDFLHSRKEMVSQGVPMETVLGPQKAIMTGLIDPSLAPTVHPISRVLSEVLSTFPNVELPQKMGMFYKIYLTMRVNFHLFIHFLHIELLPSCLYIYIHVLFRQAEQQWLTRNTVAGITHDGKLHPNACLASTHGDANRHPPRRMDR